jgi:hypothetical protein
MTEAKTMVRLFCTIMTGAFASEGQADSEGRA